MKTTKREVDCETDTIIDQKEDAEKKFFQSHSLEKHLQKTVRDNWYSARYRLIEEGNEGTTCIQCKGTQVEYVFRQTRSADEGMTVYYTCRDCGRQWHE
jgi:DNA-directed RNA polymerase I subunit RPA12